MNPVLKQDLLQRANNFFAPIPSKLKDIGLQRCMSSVIDKIKYIFWSVFYTIKNFLVRTFYPNRGKVFMEIKQQKSSLPPKLPLPLKPLEKPQLTLETLKTASNSLPKDALSVVITETLRTNTDLLNHMIEERTKSIVGEKEYERVENAIRKGCYMVGYTISIEQEKALNNLPEMLLTELLSKREFATDEAQEESLSALIDELRCQSIS